MERHRAIGGEKLRKGLRDIEGNIGFMGCMERVTGVLEVFTISSIIESITNVCGRLAESDDSEGIAITNISTSS